MNRMIPVGWDDSLCEGWIPSELGMDRMGSLAGTDGRERTELKGQRIKMVVASRKKAKKMEK